MSPGFLRHLLRFSLPAGAWTAPRCVCWGLVLVCAEVAVITFFRSRWARSSSMNVSHFPVGFFFYVVLWL